jgi:2-polyprenyl-3-methyl-5-hydroxy-6-metoxy-1,4-benzoquinol methylase/Zn ribbon nucleic-acid-binding protein
LILKNEGFAVASMVCPICEGDSSPVFEKDGHDIRDCIRCDHRFTRPTTPPDTHVKSVYTDDYFIGGGAGYANYVAEEKLLRQRGHWYARLLSKHISPGHILDVGAAAGFILQGFVDQGWTGSGVEPNNTMATLARSRLGLEVWTGMMEHLADDLQYDVVSMIQVLPHFVDPKRAIGTVAKILRPGGLLLIETWNRGSVTAKLLGKSWHEYSPPSVLHWFTPSGVAHLAKPFHLSEIARGRPAKRILASHGKSLMRFKLGSSIMGRVFASPLKLIPDGLVLPYPAEDLFWMVLKKQPV